VRIRKASISPSAFACT